MTAERFTVIACTSGEFIVTDPAFVGGAPIVLADGEAVIRHCSNIIRDERTRARERRS